MPAGPDPHASATCASAPTAPSTRAAATRRAPTSWTTARWASRQPVRRPARGRGRRPDAADQRGRGAAQPGPPHARRTRPRSTARILRVNPDTGEALPTNPLAGEHRSATPAGSSPTGSATRSGSRSARARARSGSATWAGTPRRRSTAIPTPPTHRRELRLALLRGQRPPGRLRRREPQPVREPLRGRRVRPTAVLTYAHSAKVHPEDTCPTGGLVGIRNGLQPVREHPARRSSTARCSSPTTPAAASGRWSAARDQVPIPRRSGGSAPAPRCRWTSSSGPAATSSTPTSGAAGSSASTTRAATRPQAPSPRPRPRRATCRWT